MNRYHISVHAIDRADHHLYLLLQNRFFIIRFDDYDRNGRIFTYELVLNKSSSMNSMLISFHEKSYSSVEYSQDSPISQCSTIETYRALMIRLTFDNGLCNRFV